MGARVSLNRAESLEGENQQVRGIMARWIHKGTAISGSMKGFTLIEVIVTLLMAGVLGAFLAPTLGNGLSSSARPVQWMRDHYLTMQLVEKMTAVHKKQMHVNGDNALANLKTLIEDGTLVDLQKYNVQTRYIGFDANRMEKIAPDGDTILKVTLSRKSDGHKTVVIYTR